MCSSEEQFLDSPADDYSVTSLTNMVIDLTVDESSPLTEPMNLRTASSLAGVEHNDTEGKTLLPKLLTPEELQMASRDDSESAGIKVEEAEASRQNLKKDDDVKNLILNVLSTEEDCLDVLEIRRKISGVDTLSVQQLNRVLYQMERDQAVKKLPPRVNRSKPTWKING